MAHYGEDSNPDAKTSYLHQLHESDQVGKKLKALISSLETSLSGGDSISERKDISNKCEHLKASCSLYLGVRKFCKMMDIRLEDKYGVLDEHDVLDDGDKQNEKKEMDAVYNQMTRLLHVFEARMKAVAQAPNSWFSIQLQEATTWLQANPKMAVEVTVAGGAIAGGTLAATNYCNGQCLIHYLIYGKPAAGWSCTPACGSWGLAGSAAIGAVSGMFLAGLLVAIVGYAIKCYNSYDAKDTTSEALKSIDAMVEKMKEMTQDEVLEKLQELHHLCDKALGAEIPQLQDDQICVICLEEGSSVKQPTKAPHCKAQHFMCKDCWPIYLTTHGLKCPVCRV
eukprot:TRINITY_DN6982_c0_g4_i1.p1 TRINITY_DN6982_c0_g4~~TRINITY_DN6982_c0_g4_i1.p1  ORF type:complete len:338 (+),score=56.82 TRINITY_DN6982_c0_g4_i1:76-1089(+)